MSFVPMLFEDLTPAERRWVCNGCGPKLGLGPDVVPDFIFTVACNRHDFAYWLGFSQADRLRADTRFREAMLKAAAAQPSWWARRWYSFLAWRYYAAVRLFGGRAFSYRQHYATRADLEREMRGSCGGCG